MKAEACKQCLSRYLLLAARSFAQEFTTDIFWSIQSMAGMRHRHPRSRLCRSAVAWAVAAQNGKRFMPKAGASCKAHAKATAVSAAVVEEQCLRQRQTCAPQSAADDGPARLQAPRPATDRGASAWKCRSRSCRRGRRSARRAGRSEVPKSLIHRGFPKWKDELRSTTCHRPVFRWLYRAVCSPR